METPASLLPLLLTAITLLIAVKLMGSLRMTFRGRFGRPYHEVVEELFAETERRAALLAEFASAREGRIERADERLEPTR